MDDVFKVPLGGLTALAGALVLNYFNQWSRERAEQRNLSSAFAGEIGALKFIIEDGNYVGRLGHLLEQAKVLLIELKK